MPTRGFLLESIKESDDVDTAEAYIQRLNEQLYNVLTASATHTNRLYKHLRSNESDHHVDINVGDYVLVSYPDRPPTKLTPLYRGPMIVIDKIRDDGFLCQDIVTQTQLQVSKDRIKLFTLPATYDETDLKELAAADHEEFIVERILDMKGNPRKKKTLQFLVEWKGYDDSENTWEPWSNVRNLEALDEYIRSHPGLKLN